MFNLLKEKFKGLIERAVDKAGKKETETEKTENAKLTKITRIKSMLTGTIRLSDSDLENILGDFQIDIIRSDVAVPTSEAIIEKLKKKLLNQDIDKNNVGKFVRDSLRDALLDTLKTESEINIIRIIQESERPFKIVFFGINGSGKTTTIAKFARYLMKNGFSVVLAAGDTFRAGAIEQISKHADSLNVRVISHQKGADSAAVIYDAIEHAKARKIDVVLADTAGRMQTNVNLMDEMKKICRINKPNLKIFVGDALTGNDAIDQAEKFNKEIGIDAIILTKMDSDAKGGCAFSMTDITKKPVILIGTGQSYDDLKEFNAEWLVDRILG